jgi:hypothetical protein
MTAAITVKRNFIEKNIRPPQLTLSISSLSQIHGAALTLTPKPY